MEISTIIWTVAVALVGLNLCGRYEEKGMIYPHAWCTNSFIRSLYVLIQILGVVFTFGLALYLTLTEHWWYILIYIGWSIVAKLIAKVLQMPIDSIFSDCWSLYREVQVRKLLGSIMIIIGIVAWALSL